MRAFFLENGAYIMLGSRVPNMWVFTSLWAETSRTWCKSIESIRKVLESIERPRKNIKSIESGLQTPAGRPDSKLEVQVLYFYTFTRSFWYSNIFLYFYLMILHLWPRIVQFTQYLVIGCQSVIKCTILGHKCEIMR